MQRRDNSLPRKEAFENQASPVTKIPNIYPSPENEKPHEIAGKRSCKGCHIDQLIVAH
jgi:hypothetical protein